MKQRRVKIMITFNLGEQLKIIEPVALQLANPNDNSDIIFTGAEVMNALTHYESREMIRNLTTVWVTFKALFWKQYYKNYEMLNSDIDPLTNYDYSETKIKTNDNGDKTKTHAPDNTKNYVETTIETDVTKTFAAGTGANQPKTDTYNLAYDTEPKHTGYTTQSGNSTETTKTTANGNKSKTIDNLKYTDTESHSQITKTIGDTSITADEIVTEKIEKHGTQNIDKLDMLKRAIELNKISILNDYITHFIDKYTFFVGGEI